MDNMSKMVGANCVLNKLTLAAGSTTDLIKISANAEFVIDGIVYSKTADAAGFAWSQHTTFAAHAAKTSRLYGLIVDKDGNIKQTQGQAIVTNSESNMNALQIPAVPKGYALLGLVRVSLDSDDTAGFTPDTTALTTSGDRTVAFYDTMVPPSQPIVF
jgi:hypothetical protein